MLGANHYRHATATGNIHPLMAFPTTACLDMKNLYLHPAQPCLERPIGGAFILQVEGKGRAAKRQGARQEVLAAQSRRADKQDAVAIEEFRRQREHLFAEAPRFSAIGKQTQARLFMRYRSSCCSVRNGYSSVNGAGTQLFEEPLLTLQFTRQRDI